MGGLGLHFTSCASCYSMFYSILFTGSFLNPVVLSQEQDKADTERNICRIRHACYVCQGWGPGAKGCQGEGTGSADAVMKSSLADLKWYLETEATGESGQQSSLEVHIKPMVIIAGSWNMEKKSRRRYFWCSTRRQRRGGILMTTTMAHQSHCALAPAHNALGLKSCPHSHAYVTMLECRSGHHWAWDVRGQELQEGPVALGACIFFWKFP